MAITSVRDSHSCPSADFSRSKFLVVAFLSLVVVAGDLGQSGSPLRSSELLSPGGPGSTTVVLVFSFP